MEQDGKKKRGRPSLFNDKLRDKLLKLALDGATDKELGRAANVSERTIQRWRAGKSAEDFCRAIKESKGVADELVEATLFQRATGYHAPETKSTYDKDLGKWVHCKVMKWYPPSEVAAIFWLKNRNPDAWREKQEIDLTSDITITIADDEQAL